MASPTDKLLVQIASYNTNLQGNLGLPQDLVDWLSPTLTVSRFLSREKQTADIVAVGFQELLPLHFGLSGISRKVIESRDALIRSQIEEHAPGKDRYTLVARVVNVGIALLVYVRDAQIAQRVCDVQTQWTGCGPGYMGNKGAVGVRFRITGNEENVGETFTFVNAHLTAHAHKLASRIADYHHIVGTLLFPPPTPTSGPYTTIYETSHLFFLGDLNFRLALPPTHPFAEVSSRPAMFEALKDELEREKLKEFDELRLERKKGNVFVGLREADFWKFKCTYKYRLKEVDKYNGARLPAWTDRVLYATYSDLPESPEESHIEPILYTSIPSYTTSDHKPIVALLLVPTHTLAPSASAQNSSSLPSPSPSPSPSSPAPPEPLLPRIPPVLQLPASFDPAPAPYWALKRYTGRALDRIVGLLWTFLWLVGLGSAAVGVGNFVFGVVAWRWMSARGMAAGPGPSGAAPSTVV